MDDLDYLLDAAEAEEESNAGFQTLPQASREAACLQQSVSVSPSRQDTDLLDLLCDEVEGVVPGSPCGSDLGADFDAPRLRQRTPPAASTAAKAQHRSQRAGEVCSMRISVISRWIVLKTDV